VGGALDDHVEDPRRRGFRFAREELAEERPRAEHDQRAHHHADPAKPDRQRQVQVLFASRFSCARSRQRVDADAVHHHTAEERAQPHEEELARAVEQFVS